MSDPTDQTPCLFCGGDISAPDHEQRCDGRQGGRDESRSVSDWQKGPQRDDGRPTIAFGTTATLTAVVASKVDNKRQTSVQAFYNAVDSGMVKTRQQQIWAALNTIGVSTANEIFRYLKHRYGLVADLRGVTPRFTELRDLGLIREVTERPCDVTGEICITYQAVQSWEHKGLAVVHRCGSCGQITFREVPRPRVDVHP